jgi:hypothetical protein
LLLNPTWHFFVKCRRCRAPIKIGEVAGDAGAKPLQRMAQFIKTNRIHTCFNRFLAIGDNEPFECGHRDTYSASDIMHVVISIQRTQAASVGSPVAIRRGVHEGCHIILCSYEVKATTKTPAGWVPQGQIICEEDRILTSVTLTGNTIESTQDAANAIIVARAFAINKGDLPKGTPLVPSFPLHH